MPSNAYHFEDHWQIPQPIEAVWDLLSRPEGYPIWWKDVYLSARALDNSAHPCVGARVALVAKGKLPYKLRFTIETTKLARPTLIEFSASGDFRTEASRWILRPLGGSTEVTLDWNPIVEKPIVKLLSPLLKPVFRWNHDWTMRVGQQQIVAHMAAR